MDDILERGGCAADRRRRRARAQIDAAELVAQVAGPLVIRSDVGVKDHVIVGGADDLDSVAVVVRDGHLRLDRRLEAADGVTVRVAVDHDSVAEVGDFEDSSIRHLHPDRGVGHLHAGRVAAELDAVTRLPETMQVRIRLLPPLDVIRIPSPLFGSDAAEGEGPGEGVERDESAGLAAHLDAVLVVAGNHVAERDHAADLRIPGRA